MLGKKADEPIEGTVKTDIGIVQNIPYLMGEQVILYNGLKKTNEKIWEIFPGNKVTSFLHVFSAMLSSDGIKDLYERVVENEQSKKSPPEYFSLTTYYKSQILKYSGELPIFAVDGGQIRIRKIGDAVLFKFLENVLTYTGKNSPTFRDEVEELLKTLYKHRDDIREDREKKKREAMVQSFI